MAVVLRDYQEAAIQALNAGVSTRTSQAVIMATGMGKTVVASDFMKRWAIPGDILFLAHRRELLDQTVKTYERLTGEMAYLEMGACKAPDLPMWGNRRVVVGSVQSIRSRLQQPRFDPDRFSLVVVDECHHGTAQSYLKILEHFGILRRVEAADGKPNFVIADAETARCRCVGLTATAKRTDDEALDQIFGDDPTYEMNIWDGIQKGWLVNVDQKAIEVQQLDLDSISRRRNESGEMDFAPAELEALMNEEGPLHEVADATLREIGDRQAIVFAAGVTHAKLLAEVMNRRRLGVADAIYGSMDEERRKKITGDFKGGRLQVLINVMIATEGFDHPPTACVVMARPTGSLLIYTQCLGRGTRPLAGCVDGIDTPEGRRAAIAASTKPNCLVLDFVGNSTKHKLVTAVDVMGGEHSVQLRERASDILAAAGAGNVEEAINKAEAELVSEINREVRKRFVPKSVYEMYDISPFDTSSRPGGRQVASSAGGATDKQIEALGKLGVRRELALQYSVKQAGAVLESLRKKRCTFGQAKSLQKFGKNPAEFNFYQAMQMLDTLFGKQKAGAR
jgi:superfamily II DNA or RNA helicase